MFQISKQMLISDIRRVSESWVNFHHQSSRIQKSLKWSHFSQREHGIVVNLSRTGRLTKIPSRAHQRLVQEVFKESRTTAKALQAFFEVRVQDSTIRKRWRSKLASMGKFQNYWWAKNKKAWLAKKKNKTAWCSPRLLENNSMDWQDKSVTFWKMCCRHIWSKTNNVLENTSYRQPNMVLWGWVSALGWLLIYGTMNSNWIQ